MKQIYFIISLMFCLGAWGQDSETVDLHGRVIDENNEPVSFCMIRVEGQAAATTANIDGKYSISFQTADTVRIIFNMMGYQKRVRTLTKPRGNMALNIIMHTSGQEMSELEIKEMRRQMGQTQTVNTTELKHLPSSSGNAVEELISTQAGVSTHNELSSQYNVRGGNFDENCVYINGAEVYRPLLIHSGEQEGLSVINPFMVDKIEFSAGGFSARYGDKMSSVLDITYKKPTTFEANASLSMLGASAYAGFGNKKVSFSNSLRYKTNRYMLGALETDGDYSPNFVDYQAYLSWSPAKDWTVDVIGYFSQNDYRFTPSTRETSFGTLENMYNFKVYFDGWEQDLFRTIYGTAKVGKKFGDKHRLSMSYTAFQTRERETYDIQGQYWLTNASVGNQLAVGTYSQHARNLLNSNQQALRLDYEYKTTNHNVLAGFGFRHESIRENSREWEYRDSSQYSMPHTGNTLEVIYNLKSINEISSNHIEFFAEDTWRRVTKAGRWSINYGMRGSYWSWNSEFLLSPRLSVGFVPESNENLTFRMATGLYYQRPFYKEIKDTVTIDHNTYVQLNKDIKSQRSIQMVLGMDYHFRVSDRPFKFTTELYYKNQSYLNPYNVDNVKIVYYGRNIASGYVLGADFKLYGEFIPGTDSWISFSLMKASMNLNGKTIPQPTDQLWNINFFFTDFFPGSTRWKMNLKGCFAGGLPFGPTHTGLENHVFRSPAYKRLDVGLTYRALNNEDHHLKTNWVRNIWLGIDCLNVFGFDNVSGYYWITDVQNNQYGIPNFLTGRRFNVRLSFDF